MIDYSSRLACITIMIGMLFTSCKKHISPADQDEEEETQPADLFAVNKKLGEPFGGYYIALPAEYSKTTKKYPLLVYLHGLGQMGNGNEDLVYLLNDGIGKLLKNKTLPASFKVKGVNYSFIVVSPQASRRAAVYEVGHFIEEIMKTYRVDEKRLYLSGLSLGSRIASEIAGQYPQAFAALVTMAGVAPDPGLAERSRNIAEANLPVWAFHNIDDPMSDWTVSDRFVKMIRDLSPPHLPRVTIFDVYGHDAWTTALNPSYKEDGMSIYEWMLLYSR